MAAKQEVARQIQSMQKADVIQLSHTPWASPIMLVHKKDVLTGCVLTTEN